MHSKMSKAINILQAYEEPTYEEITKLVNIDELIAEDCLNKLLTLNRLGGGGGGWNYNGKQ